MKESTDTLVPVTKSARNLKKKKAKQSESEAIAIEAELLRIQGKEREEQLIKEDLERKLEEEKQVYCKLEIN
jgi:hypothetical protein